ncbi:Protein ACTIVITY OF BC1 COMPLEX KINASE 7, chloroplastic, partial [Mucuna pruriens]
MTLFHLKLRSNNILTTETMAMLGCYCHCMKLATHRRTVDNLGFSGSISVNELSKNEKRTCDPSGNTQFGRFLVEMRQRELPASKYGTNGRAVKMVPTKELANKVVTVNGSASKQAVNGTGLVRKNAIPALIKTVKSRTSKQLPSLEELKVLPTDDGFSWANENYSSWQRSIDVWSFVVSLRIRILMDNAKWAYLGGFTEAKQKSRRQKTASWLRERVLQLGPTFIKIGQLSSTRSDLFPREFVNELAKLQDMVPAFSAKKARNFIEVELGAPIDILFEEFEDRPIAAASLGQVHRAILHNGEKVVVKVQRPGLKKLFDIDLQNLKLIAEYFQRSETFGGPTRDWIGIYKECATILYQEIDYVNEGKNADRFRRDFRNIKWVRIPLVYWDYTALKVLTMEYVPGIKIDQVDTLTSRGYDRLRIASRATEAYLIQILRTGFFHADPHPGNLAIDVDEAIIYYDFGMMGEIKSFTRERLLELFYAIYEKDAKKVMQSLIDLGALEPTGDLSPVRRSVQFFLDHLLSQAPDQEQTLSAIGEDLFAIAQDQPFRFPSTFAFVLRAFSTLEGIGYTLNPNFSFSKIAAPFAQELLDIRQKQRTGTQLVEEIRKQADDARSYTMSMPYRVQRIEEFTKQLEAGDLKLRVRVLESERAARKATALQMATMYTVLGGTLLNLGIIMSSQGNIAIANGSFIGAGVFMTLFVRSMQRVKLLDKVEKMI